jgi:hypothetical protein
MNKNMKDDTYTEPPQLYWSELAELTHISQVNIYGWCACEDGPKVYEDCDQTGLYPEDLNNQNNK